MANASENIRVTGRITRIDEDTLEYAFTVVDPDPGTEGNYGMAKILSGQRVAERESGEEVVESVSLRAIVVKLTGVVLTASLLVVAPANAVEVEFIAFSAADQWDARTYRAIWEESGERIVAAFEVKSGRRAGSAGVRYRNLCQHGALMPAILGHCPTPPCQRDISTLPEEVSI